MKILLLNGSPRANGNTRAALQVLAGGIRDNIPDSDIELYDVTRHKVGGCIHCNGCRDNGGNCVMPDESAGIVNKIADADCIVFGSPVYWWGVSSQLKAVIDKMYSKDPVLPDLKKKIGTVIIGAGDTTDPQYRIIREQFECICAYLGWEVIFSYAASAGEAGDILKSGENTAILYSLWKEI
jgi:multimeric flavodoxin WrbA